MILKRLNKRVLIIGAGSGRDIVSTVIVREFLANECLEVDIAGFLTPWALHFFNDLIENPINDVTSISNCKKLLLRNNQELKSFFEPYIKKIWEKYEVKVNNVYVFSLQYGFFSLFREISKLIQKNKYDTIIAVDVGGDILAEKLDYKNILTPLVDWTCLAILFLLPFELRKYIALVSPGVCGEVKLDRIREILEKMKNSSSFFYRVKFDKNSEPYQKFYYINEEINKNFNSYSHTVKIINDTINLSTKINEFVYKKSYEINDKRYEIPFKVIIDKELILSVNFFSLEKLNELFFKDGYKNLLEAITKLKEAKVCGTELDMGIIPFNILKTWKDNLIYFLIPCCYVEKNIRKDIIIEGLEEILRNNKIEFIVIEDKDWELIKRNEKYLKKFYPVKIFSTDTLLILQKK